jgi:hypothetical protein
MVTVLFLLLLLLLLLLRSLLLSWLMPILLAQKRVMWVHWQQEMRR